MPTAGFDMATVHLLVTGCYRSGTTLLEKLLHAHPSACIASQAFPVLFFMAKEAFLESRQIQRRYPLDHLFGESEYSPADWTAFLENYEMTSQDVQQLFDRLEQYTDGLWTPQVLQLRDALKPGAFAEVLQRLLQLTSEMLGGRQARVWGDKEILCEEYIPFLIQQGTRVVVSVRDPRDMITSLDYRERDNLTGGHRPLLYSLRAWRKSLAYCLAHEGTANFHWLRYEDLVQHTERELHRLAEFLEVEPFPDQVAEGAIYGQDGTQWLGNSSFQDQPGIAIGSIGRYREALPEATLRYIEALCFPEMVAAGYPLAGDGRLDDSVVQSMSEPRSEIHAKFPADYSYAPHRIEDELARRTMLAAPRDALTVEQKRQWFLWETAYERLRAKT
ncbi:MAG TPA: hypothetical protein DCY79_16675 [Planctomycetaceae bacterium]|nr:hypothetical protein [Planctomycetaceae bacterium]